MWGLAALLLFTDFTAEGIKALEAQKFEEAAQFFAKAVEADPKDYSAHFHLGLAQTFMNKDAEAVAAYKKTLELKPGLYEAELNLGMVLLRQKQAAEAVPYLQQATEKKPKEFRPRFYLAEALLAAGDSENAEQHYKQAMQLDAKSAAAHLGAARAIARQNRLPEAAPLFCKAAELDASFQDAVLELAGLYEKNNQVDEAIAIYERFPNHAAAQERLGQLMLESKRYADAIPRLEAAVKQDPTTPNRLALATAYLNVKQPEKAIPLLEQAAGAEPSNYDIRMMHARALRDARQYPAAARQFHEAIKLKPDAREPWNDLAAMLFLLQSYPQAIAALDRSRQLGDNSAANWYFRALSQDKMRDYKAAQASYARFLELSQHKNPEEEFKARQRLRVIEKELSKR